MLLRKTDVGNMRFQTFPSQKCLSQIPDQTNSAPTKAVGIFRLDVRPCINQLGPSKLISKKNPFRHKGEYKKTSIIIGTKGTPDEASGRN